MYMCILIGWDSRVHIIIIVQLSVEIRWYIFEHFLRLGWHKL